MSLFVCGLRRSGTTILYDALREDPELRCFYEPLREGEVTVGGGSGAREEDAFAETRELRRRFRDERHPELPIEEFNWGGPRAPELELEPDLPDHCAGFVRHLLDLAPEVAIKETRLHHKLATIAAIAPDAALIHLVRDPRAVCASMLLGRRGRVDLYPDADAFFTVRTRRRLWSSRAISELLVERLRSLSLPPDLPDFLRPLLVWKNAFETANGDGRRLFGDRYALVRLEDLRADPASELGRVYVASGRSAPPAVAEWATANVRRDEPILHGDDPRWARAARLLGMEEALARGGYAEILALEPEGGPPLDIHPPPAPSRLSAMLGRAQGRLAERRGERPRRHRGDPGAR
ncbi:MAG: sulfotransferase [Solirubrobacterales bacterium]